MKIFRNILVVVLVAFYLLVNQHANIVYAKSKGSPPSVTYNGRTYTVSEDTYSEKYFRTSFLENPNVMTDQILLVRNNTTGEIFRLGFIGNVSGLVYVSDHYETPGAIPIEPRIWDTDEWGRPYTSSVSLDLSSPYGTYTVIGPDYEYAALDASYTYIRMLQKYNPNAYTAVASDTVTNPAGVDLQKMYDSMRSYNLEHVAACPEVLTIDENEEFNVWREARLDYYDELYHMTNGDSWYMPPEVQELLEADENAYKQMLYARRVTAVSGD